MTPRPPFRERTPAQLRQQAEEYQTAAQSASGDEAQTLLRLAGRYEELARLKETIEDLLTIG
jgi:hypothetical protein